MKFQRSLLIPLFSLVALFLSPMTSRACSLIHTPISKLDRTEYIFVGQIIGYVGPVTAPQVRGEAWGVIVKPLALVSAPGKSTGDYEIYPLQLEPDCNTSGSTEEWVSQRYPEGSTVQVAAAEMKSAAARPRGGNIRLAISPHNNGLLFRNVESLDARTLAGRLYDYRGHRAGVGATGAVAFEVRKDLWRLEQARSDAEKEEVLRRLLYSPRYGVDYTEVVKQHVSDKAKAAILIEERRRWETSGQG